MIVTCNKSVYLPLVVVLFSVVGLCHGYGERVIVEYPTGQKEQAISSIESQGWKVVVDFSESNSLAVEKVDIPSGLVRQASVKLSSLPGILKASPEMKVRLIDRMQYITGAEESMESISKSASTQQTCSNPFSELQTELSGPEWVPYGIENTQANSYVFDHRNSVNNTIYCILDGGLYKDHPDLQSPYVVMNGSSYPHRWDYDADGHGTHVTTIIAGQRNLGGVVGVSSNSARLAIVNLFGDELEIPESAVVEGWDWCLGVLDSYKESTNDDAKLIISMSLGGSEEPNAEAVQSRINQIYARGDVLMFASAGNLGTTEVMYPAGYENVISVAAVDVDNNQAEFSNRNADVQISAPGMNVLSGVIPEFGEADTPMASQLLYLTPDVLETDLKYPYPGNFRGSSNYNVEGPVVDCGKGLNTCSNSNQAICLIARGDILFCEKVVNCMNGGGIGAIIYNNLANDPTGCEAVTQGTLIGDECPDISYIPTIGISRAQGEALLSAIDEETVEASILLGESLPPYAYYSGTSMSCPYASGIAGLLWASFPTCSNQVVEEAIFTSALPLGSSNRYGAGLIQAKAAYDYLREQACGRDAPTVPPITSVPTTSPPVPTTSPPVATTSPPCPCKCSYNGVFRIKSAKCKNKYLVTSLSCNNRRVYLGKTTVYNGLRNQWTLNATEDTFGNIISRRGCDSSILASNDKLTMGSGSIWQYMLQPADDTSCDNVNLLARRRSDGEPAYLATSLDCKGFRWLFTTTSPHTEFTLIEV